MYKSFAVINKSGVGEGVFHCSGEQIWGNEVHVWGSFEQGTIKIRQMNYRYLWDFGGICRMWRPLAPNNLYNIPSLWQLREDHAGKNSFSATFFL